MGQSRLFIHADLSDLRFWGDFDHCDDDAFLRSRYVVFGMDTGNCFNVIVGISDQLCTGSFVSYALVGLLRASFQSERTGLSSEFHALWDSLSHIDHGDSSLP